MRRAGRLQLARWVLLLAGLGAVWFSVASESGPVIPAGKGPSCVADTEYMRRNHMDLIVHQRDETVIRGIRFEPFSLAECVDCHAQTTTDNMPIRVDADGQFCASCHSYAAVQIDCFGCHAAVPDNHTGTHSESVGYLSWPGHSDSVSSEHISLFIKQP